MKLGQIGIIGAGHIGGSIALALTAAGESVSVFDRSESTHAEAVGAGLRTSSSVHNLVQQSDIVIIATPMSQYPNIFSEIARHLKAEKVGPLILDVGSVQGVLHNLAGASGSFRFIGTHPMAGTELQGFAASRSDLFSSATWAITPPAGTCNVDLLQAMRIVQACGAHSLVIDVATHDNIASQVSHVPHVVSSLVATSIRGSTQDLALSLAAGSFRDITRVAASSPQFTTDLVTKNRAEVQRSINRLVEQLLQIRDALGHDEHHLIRHFESARGVRQQLMSREFAVRLHFVPKQSDYDLAEALRKICHDGSRIDSCEITTDGYRVRVLSMLGSDPND